MKLQTKLDKWQRKSFPLSTPESKIKHLKQEIIELEEALQNNDKTEIAYELADCGLLLFGIAGLLNIDLIKSIKEKYKINQSRTWEQPTEDNIYYHKKD